MAATRFKRALEKGKQSGDFSASFKDEFKNK